ncbi:MAG TPA: GNAT family N-acetyltransferase [Mycobacterium sp.]|nr:GNAT family N-acetyltransferase [Mycobacterium sp.]
MTEPTVTNAHQQYEICVDGVRAGVAAYVDVDAQRIFHHTEVEDEFGGRGLGTKLIAAALADTRAAGKRIVPMCSFVAAYVDKHREYADVADPVTPQAQAAVDAQPG